MTAERTERLERKRVGVTRAVRLNGAYRGQRVTGQQRYASELTERLVRTDGVSELHPPAQVATRSTLSWLWALTLPLRIRPDTILVTFTSRGPVAALRHVLTVHDLFVLEHPEWYSRSYVLTHAPLLRLQLRLATAVVTVSEPVAAQIRPLVRRPERVVVVPNAPADVFTAGRGATDDEVLQLHGLQAQGYLLSVGSTDPRKNIARLTRAYASLPDDVRAAFPLVLVGGAHRSFSGAGGFSDGSARHIGYVTDDELAALYRGAKAVVFPTLDEGFGLPAVEALACGSALVVSDVPVMRWVCGDVAEYVDPQDEASIARGLRRIVEASSDRATRRARIEAAARFSWDASAAQLVRLIDTLS